MILRISSKSFDASEAQLEFYEFQPEFFSANTDTCSSLGLNKWLFLSYSLKTKNNTYTNDNNCT